MADLGASGPSQDLESMSIRLNRMKIRLNQIKNLVQSRTAGTADAEEILAEIGKVLSSDG